MFFVFIAIAATLPVPLFQSDDPALADAAAAAWPSIVEACDTLSGAACRSSLERLRIDYDDALGPREAGRSDFDRVEAARIRLRHGGEALRHELAHALLSSMCPSANPLLQEAFAMRAADELRTWQQAPYQTLAQALQALHSMPLDSANARGALARLLAESAGEPAAMRSRLLACAEGGVSAPLTAEDLIAGSEVAAALVVVDRLSGEVLISEGATALAMPPGSTLKSFVVAGHDDAPELARDGTRAEWQCGKAMAKSIGVDEALWRSCNGYFLDWGVSDYGSFTPLIARLSGTTPHSAAEAIGLAPIIHLSPLQLAEAYRALSFARPAVLKTLRQTTRAGTLAGIDALADWSTKTGTVREPDGSVRVGWIVAVNAELVAVRAVPGRRPRDFANALGTRLRALHFVGAQKAEVQVFGLLPLREVALRCPGVAIAGSDLSAPKTADDVRAPALCLGAPWLVTIEDHTRRYQGVFTRSPAPPAQEADSERHAHARRGSDVIFSTSLALYTGGVLAAEDSSISGQARRALASVVAHNASVASAHAPRPLCDTTHCQAFRGTAPVDANLLLLAGGFLPFSRGGDEAWSQRVPRDAITQRFGDVVDLSFSHGHARLVVADANGEALRDLGCELVRAPLQLPSCPDRAEQVDGAFVFFGHGRGHGLGLDVEAAKQSQERAEVLLERAYRE